MSKNLGNDFFTGEDLRLLDKTTNLREKMIDAITDNGNDIPDKTNELRILNELMMGLDKKVIDMSNIRAKVSKDQDDTAYQELVIETLKEAAINKKNGTRSDEDILLPDNLIPVDIVDGEIEINPIELEVDDFIDRGDD